MRKSMVLPALALTLVFSFVAMPQMVGAREGDGDTATAESSEKAREEAKKLAEQRREAEKKRLESLREAEKRQAEDAKKQSEAERERSKQAAEAFKKACENRRESFKTRMENMNERAKRHAERLGSITERVEAFKEKNNVEVANYDALLEAIATKKEVLANLIETTKEEAEGFACGEDEGEAKANLATYKDALQQQIAALKEYKTAVKNLIVAVKTAQEGAENEQ